MNVFIGVEVLGKGNYLLQVIVLEYLALRQTMDIIK